MAKHDPPAPPATADDLRDRALDRSIEHGVLDALAARTRVRRRVLAGLGGGTLLARHFLGKLARRLGRPLAGFTPGSERRLADHHWPGNVRELENVIERAAVLADGPLLDVAVMDAGYSARGERPPPDAATAPGRASMVAALERAGWKVTGPRGAAAALAMHPNTLRYRMRRLDIHRPCSV
jgi:transcriptional regulator with GAF, ATPase, and Fis domain